MTLPNDHPREIRRAVGQPLRFTAQTAESLGVWTRRLRGRLAQLLQLDVLDDWAGPLAARIEPTDRQACDGYVREKLAIDAGPLGVIPTYLLTPDPLPAPAPAILCLHGHGGYHAGKDMVAGIEQTHPIARECAEALNYGYGVQMARAGYVTLCPDAYGFGERMTEADRWTTDHLCNAYHDRIASLGLSHLGLTTWSNRRVLDVAAALPQVRDDRFGCIGLSYGGVQAVMVASVDDRIAATVISGSLSDDADRPNTDCRASRLPGMTAWFDRPDVAISLAPRAVLFEFMRQDSCLDFDRAWRWYEYVEAGYRRLGAGDRIEHDIADTDHRYIGRRAPAFFERWLAATVSA